MTVTIKDIAQQAKVSYATVSRAFSNKYVSPKTRARILEIAKRLNYSPNGIARGLVTKQTNTIGLILPDITNPFYPEVARGVEDGAKEQGYSVFLCNTNWERERENQYIELLMEKRVDGLLISPGSNVVDPVQEHLTSAIRVVYMCEVPRKTDRSYVAIDNVRGGFLATRHLIEAGYTRIGFIGGIIEPDSTDERLDGYRLAFAHHGLAVEDRYIRLGHFDQDSGARIIMEMIHAGDFPRAVFAENDLLALGVIEGVRSAGLSVPEDVAVVGFDDIPIASFREVQLTTVLQPKYDIGKTAVKILLEEINASLRAQKERRAVRTRASLDDTKVHDGRGPTRVVIEPRLMVRKTSIVTGGK